MFSARLYRRPLRAKLTRAQAMECRRSPIAVRQRRCRGRHRPRTERRTGEPGERRMRRQLAHVGHCPSAANAGVGRHRHCAGCRCEPPSRRLVHQAVRRIACFAGQQPERLGWPGRARAPGPAWIEVALRRQGRAGAVACACRRCAAAGGSGAGFEIMGKALDQSTRQDAALAGRTPDPRLVVAWRRQSIHGCARIQARLAWIIAQDALAAPSSTVHPWPDEPA